MSLILKNYEETLVQYFITGASGFIGRRLVKKLLERDDSIVYFLVRSSEKDALAGLYEYWECDAKRAIPIVGDLTEPELGVVTVDRKKLGKKPHIFFIWLRSTIFLRMPIFSSRSMWRARAIR
jgi:hypothetical protein